VRTTAFLAFLLSGIASIATSETNGAFGNENVAYLCAGAASKVSQVGERAASVLSVKMSGNKLEEAVVELQRVHSAFFADLSNLAVVAGPAGYEKLINNDHLLEFLADAGQAETNRALAFAALKETQSPYLQDAEKFSFELLVACREDFHSKGNDR